MSSCNGNNRMIGAAFAFASTLSSANGLMNSNIGSRHQISSSPPASGLRMTHRLLYDEDDEEAFRNLYQETSIEGLSLVKEFEERQIQLEKDRQRLSETFNIDADINSASLFNTANPVVMSTPSMRSRSRSPPITTAPAVNEDNWAMILCMSVTAQLSQQAAVLQDLYPTQLIQHQQQQELLQKQKSVVIFVCVLAAAFASGSGYLELTTTDSQIPSMNSFHF